MTWTCDFEPLADGARLAWAEAPRLCRPEHGCADYHRSWSVVRLLELGGELPAGYPFFARELRGLARLRGARVLVSGGADTGVTAIVARALREAGAQARIVFVDRCRTPCRQNEHFARFAGLDLEAYAVDARDIACEPVDAVVAHSFLHLLPAGVRPAVVQAWARVTRPGARVLVSTAISADEGDWVRTRDPQRIGERRGRLAEAATAAGFGADEAREIAGTAARFWATSPGQPPALTRANLRALFEAAGFVLERLDTEPLGGDRGPLSLATRETSRRERAELVAVRA